MSYRRLLRHPKWQKTRLSVFTRDNWSCIVCGKGEHTGTSLQVHHTKYIKGRKPWQYPLSSLATLCEGCHYTISKKPETPKARRIQRKISIWLDSQKFKIKSIGRRNKGFKLNKNGRLCYPNGKAVKNIYEAYYIELLGFKKRPPILKQAYTAGVSSKGRT